jgi:cyclopropane-fatty-acyl-phospholipid synthase
MGISEAAQSQRRQIFDTFFERYTGPSFSVRLWDGWRWISPARGEPVCTIVLNSPGALQALIARPSEVTLGEAFLEKDVDVEGDIFAVFDVAEHIFECPRSQRQRTLEAITGVFLGIGQWWNRGRTHSVERDHSAISHHYDQPPEFYRPWLGRTMAYSCAYFASPDDSIDEAQENKLELICRKLRLQPGERFLDIGCGWGSLILHAASRHNVHAQGITISHEQAALASSRIGNEGLANTCEVGMIDYRQAPEQLPLFDKIASVGMFEHVGLKNMPIYFEKIYKLLKPGGVFLNHAIARGYFQGSRGPSLLSRLLEPFLRDGVVSRPSNCSFIDKYVFPDGELLTISEALKGAEAAHFEVRDVENLREHYELTLRRWVEGLQRNSAVLLKMVPETTYRIWLLYMAGSAAAFHRGDIAVFQTLLSKPEHGRSGVPLRREDWYTASGTGERAGITASA